MTTVRTLTAADVELVRGIDRAEHVDMQYAVVDGRLVEAPVFMADIPRWDPDGTGQHSVAAQVAAYREDVERGGVLLGAFEDDEVAGLAVVVPSHRGDLAQLAALHVSRPFRRRGVAGALWDEAARIARAAGASAMYVSATPTGSAVGFYLGKGCRLADPPDPVLVAKEPDDIHLVCPLD